VPADGRTAAWSPTRPLWRQVRATTVGAGACGLAATAHASAGGHASPLVTLLGAVLVSRCCWTATRRRMGPLRLAAVAVAVQWVMHAGYALAGPPSGGAGPAGHGMAPAAAGRLAAGDLLLGWGDGRMALAHLTAGALLGLWLAAGERAFWGVATRLGRAVVRRVVRLVAERHPRCPGPARPLRARPAGGVPPVAGGPVLQHVVVRRGPPRRPATGTA
jgi:hypothetical protein